jgi:hypothetical protein
MGVVPFKNFSIWRGRLPHWRADDVCYYVTFRHRRDLDDAERRVLFRELLRPDKRKWDLLVLCVLPATTELIFTVRADIQGAPIEIADIVEPAKRRAGRKIVHNTGERFAPFYTESYDRIVRDEAELQERHEEIVMSSVAIELVEDPSLYETLWAGE